MKIWQLMFVFVMFLSSLMGTVFSGAFFFGSIAAHGEPGDTFRLMWTAVLFACNTAALGMLMKAHKP